MRHHGLQGLHGSAGALLAVALGMSVAGCSGIVPIGEGAGDGGGGATTGPADAGVDVVGLPGPADGGVLLDDAGLVLGDAGVISQDPDAGFTFPADAGPVLDDASLSPDAFDPSDATVFIDAADDVAFPEAGACTLAISSNHYAEDPVACDACMATSCCAQNDACGANPDCAALITCAAFCEMDGGSSSSCGASCTQQHAAGASTYVGLMQCMNTSCNLQACFPLF